MDPWILRQVKWHHFGRTVPRTLLYLRLSSVGHAAPAHNSLLCQLLVARGLNHPHFFAQRCVKGRRSGPRLRLSGGLLFQSVPAHYLRLWLHDRSISQESVLGSELIFTNLLLDPLKLLNVGLVDNLHDTFLLLYFTQVFLYLDLHGFMFTILNTTVPPQLLD